MNQRYDDNSQYLQDVFSRIDVLIRECINNSRKKDAVYTDELRGLYISEQEVDHLLEIEESRPFSQPQEESLHFLGVSSEAIKRCAHVRANSKTDSECAFRAVNLQNLYHLSSFEIDILLICLAAECDKKYGKLYAYINDDLTSKKPTIGLVFDLLQMPFWARVQARQFFVTQSSLVKNRLIDVADARQESSVSFLYRQLIVDDRVTNYLLDINQIDARLSSGVTVITGDNGGPLPSLVHNDDERLSSFLMNHLGESSPKPVLFNLIGPEGAGKLTLVKKTCRTMHQKLLIADALALFTNTDMLEDTLSVLLREAILQDAALCIDRAEQFVSNPENKLLWARYCDDRFRTIPSLVFLLTRISAGLPQFFGDDRVLCRDVIFNLPDEKRRKELWEEQLNGSNSRIDAATIKAIASMFRFTPGQIRSAIATAQQHATWRSSGNDHLNTSDLYIGCRALSKHRLSTLANKREPRFTWADLVLKDEQIDQLTEFCNHAKYRSVVYGEWGFGRKLSLGKGLNALFFGPPGTGKTMAAEVIANELQLDLYKIDLSQVVSKYIGETEKNLDRIFTEAQTSNAILFFDEAEALFGKRSEVKDAHDRYANIEIGYLLQKMEEHEGIVILATNIRQNMDEAFTRRIQFIVGFPFPDEALRLRLWCGMFPPEARRSGDIDWNFLASKLKIAGGEIRNISVNAAFYAAREAEDISMRHLMLATRNEYRKTGKSFLKSDLSPYFELTQTKIETPTEREIEVHG